MRLRESQSQATPRKEKVRYKFDALGRRVQRFIVGGKENTKFIPDRDDVLVDLGLDTAAMASPTVLPNDYRSKNVTDL